MRQNLKPFRSVGTLYDVEYPAEGRVYPRHQRSGIPTVCPDTQQTGAESLQAGDHRFGGIAVLEVGGMDIEDPDEAQGVYGEMAFAAFDLLPRVIADSFVRLL
jgi:hypothetical protein